MSLQSTVSIAKVGTNSVRATIPEGIVAFLEIQAGDKLDWKMEVGKEGERIIIVKKLFEHKSQKPKELSSMNEVIEESMKKMLEKKAKVKTTK